MDASQSALDSLRTVEFRETLKGYHRDDVDEYLEKAAVEAEGLQEQLRQGGERLRQAAERISQLEEMLENQLPPPPPEPPVADDTLQRTLLLAQKFVDQTKADSEAEASRLIAEAEAKARIMTEEARSKADQILTQSEQQLREEISRLEDMRTKLTNEVELMSRHLESERARLRQALTDILKWVDANVHPEASNRERPPAGREAAGTPPPPPPTPPTPDGPVGTPSGPAGRRPAAAATGRARPRATTTSRRTRPASRARPGRSAPRATAPSCPSSGPDGRLGVPGARRPPDPDRSPHAHPRAGEARVRCRGRYRYGRTDIRRDCRRGSGTVGSPAH